MSKPADFPNTFISFNFQHTFFLFQKPNLARIQKQMRHNTALQPENGLNINASEWKGPVSLQLGDGSSHETPTLRTLTQQTAQLSLFPPSMDPSSYQSRQICKFFLAGGCSRGDACPFLHELPNDSTLAGSTDTATSVTGIVFNVNAKNTGTALQKQTLGDISGIGDSERSMYGEFSPMVSELTSSANEYYPSYGGNVGYASQFATASSGWSNKLTSDIDQYSKRVVSSPAHTTQYEQSTHSRSTLSSSASRPGYSGTYYGVQQYTSTEPAQPSHIAAKGQNIISGDNYWASTASSDRLLQESTSAYGMYMSDVSAAGGSQKAKEKACGPMSYAAVAQKQQQGDFETDINAGLVAVALESPELSPVKPKHTPSPIRADLKHPKHRTEILEDIEPPWKPVSKPTPKNKEPAASQPKSGSKGRRSVEPSDTDGATPNAPRLSPHSTSHTPAASHKIQLPNPLIWAKRSVDEPTKQHLRTVVHAVTGSYSPYEPHAATPPSSAENFCLRQPAALNLDGGAPPRSKDRPSPIAAKDGKPAKSVRSAHKPLSLDHLRDKKHETEGLGHRGRHAGGRGRGYGGQAYHDTRIAIDAERK